MKKTLIYWCSLIVVFSVMLLNFETIMDYASGVNENKKLISEYKKNHKIEPNQKFGTVVKVHDNGTCEVEVYDDNEIYTAKGCGSYVHLDKAVMIEVTKDGNQSKTLQYNK